MLKENILNYFNNMNTKTKSIALLALIFGIVMTPIIMTQADAMAVPDRPPVDTSAAFIIRGELTAPAGDTPFGGDVVGDYLIRIVHGQNVKISTTFDSSPAEGMVHEGWLVDVDSGYKLSLGQSNAKNHLSFSQTIVNPWIYDVLVITEEPIRDTNPLPNNPVGGVLLDKPFGTV